MAGVNKSAQRAFDVLEHFEASRRPLSLKDICDAFDYPPSSGSGLLKSLVQLGYLSYDRYSRTYMPTNRLATLGNWVTEELCDASLFALMAHLHQLTAETVVLGTQSDLHAQYVHVIPSTLPLRVHMRPGTIRPLATSGIGLALLSARTDDDIDQIVRRLNIAREETTPRLALPSVLEAVNTVRRDGYAFSREMVTAGVGLLAMLLPQARHGRLLALGIGGPVWRLEAKAAELLAVMREGVASHAAGAGETEPPRDPD